MLFLDWKTSDYRRNASLLTYHLDHHGKSPLYEQLYRAIRADIISGALKGGDSFTRTNKVFGLGVDFTF